MTAPATDEDAIEAWLAESLARWAEVRETLETESQERAQHGWYAVAYILDQDFEAPTPPQFLEILRQARGSETGWPAWMVMDGHDMRPQLRGSVIESTIEGGAVFHGDVDFWRADPSGRMFLVRGFDEDGYSRHEPGTAIDFVLPIWRIGEALLHPSRLAARLGDERAAVDVRVIWHGLRGRNLVASERRRFFHTRGPAQEDEISTSIRIADASRIPDELPELTRQLIAPLYWQFSFYEIEELVVVEELQEMRRG